MFKRIPIVVALSALMVLLLSQAGSAAISRNTIDPNGRLGRDGRVVVLTGPIECTRGDSLRVQLSVTQASTGASASGSTRLHCTGSLQQWTARLYTRGTSFEEGHSEVCASGLTRQAMTITDTRQWCAANGVFLHGGR